MISSSTSDNAERNFLIVFLLLGLGAFAALWFVFYQDKLLSHDDIAVFQSAITETLRHWLTVGYSGLFDPYPYFEGGPNYNYIRPVSQMLMRANAAVFGDAYGLHFLPYFLFLAIGASAMAAMARLLDLPVVAALSLGLFVMIQPGAVGPALLYVSFQQDTIAGIFCLTAAWMCLRGQWFGAALLLTLAVFTKETAVYAPIAAALYALFGAGLGRRRWGRALLVLVPLALWIGVRVAAFGSVMGGTYANEGGLEGLILKAVGGLAMWPAGAVEISQIKGLAKELLSGDMMAVARYPVVVAALVANLIIDLTVLLYAIAVLRRLGGRPDCPTLGNDVLLLAFAAGGFGIMVLQAYSLRFSGPFFPILALALCYAALRSDAVSRPLKSLAGLALTLFVGFALYGSALQFRSALTEQEPVRLEALRQAVVAAEADGAQRILVLNAPATTSAPTWLERHWGVAADLVYINQVHGCMEPSPAPAQLEQTDAEMNIDVTLPDCAIFLFAGQDLKTEVALATGTGGQTLPDGKQIRYAFPDATMDDSAAAGPVPDIALGKRMRITMPADAAQAILIRDPDSSTFRRLK